MKKVIFITKNLVVGELEKQLPNYVKLIYLEQSDLSIKNKVINLIKIGNIVKAIKISWYTFNSYFTKELFKSYENMSKALTVNSEIFDIAISYHTPISLSVFYTINNIKSKKKVLWIHSDVLAYEHNITLYKKYYDKYDKIFAVSKTALNKFINKFPQYKNKIDVYYNSIFYKDIEKLSEKDNGFTDSYKGIRILTVARLSYEKGLDFCINIVKKLLDNDLNIKWYLMGEGQERRNLEEKIKENNLNNNLILLGEKENPYIYMKECDIYVQPSRNEGYCIALAEAKCFYKPIVTTNFSGALEQIIHEQTGLIVEANENLIYKEIKKIN